MAATMTRTLKPCGTLAAYARHKQRGEPVDHACRLANRAASKASRAESVARRKAARSRAIVREIAAAGGVKPFQIPRCANLGCRAPLADSAGEPCWELLEGRFVCLGRCDP